MNSIKTAPMAKGSKPLRMGRSSNNCLKLHLKHVGGLHVSQRDAIAAARTQQPDVAWMGVLDHDSAMAGARTPINVIVLTLTWRHFMLLNNGMLEGCRAGLTEWDVYLTAPWHAHTVVMDTEGEPRLALCLGGREWN